MSRSHNYKTSNDLFLHAKNAYPYYPTENIEGNPFLSQPWIIKEGFKKVTFNEPLDETNVYNPYSTDIKKVTFNEPLHENFEQEEKSENKPSLKMIYETKKYVNSANPVVWGPAFWFSLHNGALRYPNRAAPVWKERMKHFILGIPVMVPCEKCSEHATSYLEYSYEKIDEVVNGRRELFEFFWEFHNVVNKSLGKPEISLDDAYRMYSGEVEVTRLKY